MKQLPIDDCLYCRYLGNIDDKCHHPKFALTGWRDIPKTIGIYQFPTWCPLDDYQKPLEPEVK